MVQTKHLTSSSAGRLPMYVLFVCFGSLPSSQQFFSHVLTGLPGFNWYLAEDKVSCSRTQCSALGDRGSNPHPRVTP